MSEEKKTYEQGYLEGQLNAMKLAHRVFNIYTSDSYTKDMLIHQFQGFMHVFIGIQNHSLKAGALVLPSEDEVIDMINGVGMEVDRE